MEAFSFVKATNIDLAVHAAKSPTASFLAGGTNLVDLMKLNVMRPTTLVDINSVMMNQVQTSPQGVHIGALVRNSDLAGHPAIKTNAPVLSQALLSGASPQLRNMATLGGNMLQRTRCPYFNDTASACNKRQPNSGCSAINGFNRNHAVLGTSKYCIATHPSDMCVAFALLEPTLHIQGTGGKREIKFADLHLEPGTTPHLEHTLHVGDLITGVDIAFTPLAKRSLYLKVRDRASYEFALASVAVALLISDGQITEARLALGGVATKPWRASAAEKVLIGAPPNDTTFKKAAEEALAPAKAASFNGFKIELARRVIIRALQLAKELRA